MTKYFVGLNFSQNGLLSRKITGFRQRFDPKFNQYSFPHMSMLAPFEVEAENSQALVETLKEEIETFFYGQPQAPMLAFTGVGVFEYKRRMLLYLNPSYCANLNFCSEMVLDICRSFISKKVKYKENKKQFLPLGIFSTHTELHQVMEHAKLEFNSNSELPIISISLYENKSGVWQERETLVNFTENIGQFLYLNQASIINS